MPKASPSSPTFSPAAARPAAAASGVKNSTLKAGLRIVRLALLSTAVYALIGAALIVGGTLPVTGGLIYIGLLLVYTAVFSTLVLGGYSRRFKDPFLGRFQVLTGLGLSLTLYSVAGPVADATLINLVLSLVYSIFVLSPRGVAKLVALELVALAVVMVACQWIAPQHYRLETQFVGYIYVLACLPFIGTLTIYIAKLHDRLARGRRELREALEVVEELAQRDELTGAFNRRYMGNLLARTVAAPGNDATPIALALIDIDHFKSVNDEYGHAAGDALLQRFATDLQDWVGDGGTIARWGGEEFLVLMPGKSLLQAREHLASLHARASQLAVDELAVWPSVSFSAGLTTLSANECPDAAVARADHAMYDAKTSGRARTVVYGESATTPEPQVVVTDRVHAASNPAY